MITEIKINNFKLLGMNNSIKLNKINVFYGQNATGKSSIMEALTLFIELIKAQYYKGRCDTEFIERLKQVKDGCATLLARCNNNG